MDVRTRWEPVARGLEDIGAGDDTPTLSCAVRVPWAEPTGALVLLHGRGTDEHDVFPLLEQIDPARRFLGIAVRGPLESEPEGHARWFDRHEDGRPVAESLAGAVAGVGAWLDAAAAVTGVPLGRTIVGGFGEGAVMALALGLGRSGAGRPAGLILLAGWAPVVEGVPLDAGLLTGLPVAVGQALEDTVVPEARVAGLLAMLDAGGAVVTHRAWHGGHAVGPDFLRRLAPWAYRVLAQVRYTEEVAESTRGFSPGASVARPAFGG
jgi:phospholipase/carboxylesterase